MILIVDGGSIENLVSPKFIEKLNLKFISQPNAYTVFWLQKDHNANAIVFK